MHHQLPFVNISNQVGLAKDEGPPEMVEISDAIRDGAEGFFRTQYSTISKMAVLLAFVILCIYLFRSLTPQQEAAGLGRAMSAYITVAAFFLGALCSGIAGYVGMWVSVRANVRVSSAARRSAREALQVQYQSDQFLDKNKDYVVAEHQDLLNASKCSFVSGLFPPLPKESSKSKFSSIGTHFKLQLQQLMETLNCTEPHYIRCVKPNNLLQPTVFDNANVLHQLRSGGVLEAIRVKCAGYPTNRTFIEFLNRFVILAPEILKGEYEAEVACKWILEKKGLTGYQIGKSKIFLRAGQMVELDAHRTRVLSEAAKMLQGQVRTRLTRERYVLMRRASVHIQANWRGNLARKISKDMRREEAAIKIQKNLRRAKLRLPPLKWSNSLARYASRWARTRRGDCNLIHSGGPYGENLFWGSGKGWNPRNAVVAWASEKKYYDRRTYRCKANGDCLHYTQLVWKKSSRIGCGISFCKSGDTFIICNYDPPGNIVGQPPF